jgi:hypothetical protein
MYNRGIRFYPEEVNKSSSGLFTRAPGFNKKSERAIPAKKLEIPPFFFPNPFLFKTKKKPCTECFDYVSQNIPLNKDPSHYQSLFHPELTQQKAPLSPSSHLASKT